MEQVKLSDLPFEILLHICGYLSIKENYFLSLALGEIGKVVFRFEIDEERHHVKKEICQTFYSFFESEERLKVFLPALLFRDTSFFPKEFEFSLRIFERKKEGSYFLYFSSPIENIFISGQMDEEKRNIGKWIGERKNKINEKNVSIFFSSGEIEQINFHSNERIIISYSNGKKESIEKKDKRIVFDNYQIYTLVANERRGTNNFFYYERIDGTIFYLRPYRFHDENVCFSSSNCYGDVLCMYRYQSEIDTPYVLSSDTDIVFLENEYEFYPTLPSFFANAFSSYLFTEDSLIPIICFTYHERFNKSYVIDYFQKEIKEFPGYHPEKYIL